MPRGFVDRVLVLVLVLDRVRVRVLKRVVPTSNDVTLKYGDRKSGRVDYLEIHIAASPRMQRSSLSSAYETSVSVALFLQHHVS